MYTTHFIVGHAVLVPIVFAALGAALFAARHLGEKDHGGGLGDPLDVDLARRWDIQPH